TVPCSLRDAVAFANNNPGTDISVPAGTYNLSAGGLGLSADMTITGAAASTTIIDGGNSFVPINAASGITVNISGLTIRNGHSSCCGNGGGGIITQATMTISNSIISGNNAPQQNAGAILNGDDLGHGGVLT